MLNQKAKEKPKGSFSKAKLGIVLWVLRQEIVNFGTPSWTVTLFFRQVFKLTFKDTGEQMREPLDAN